MNGHFGNVPGHIYIALANVRKLKSDEPKTNETYPNLLNTDKLNPDLQDLHKLNTDEPYLDVTKPSIILNPDESQFRSEVGDVQVEPIVTAVPSNQTSEFPSPSLLIELPMDQIDLSNLGFDLYFNEEPKLDPSVSVEVPSMSPKRVRKRARVLFPGDPPPLSNKKHAHSLLRADTSNCYKPKTVNITCKLCRKDLRTKIRCIVCKGNVCLECSETVSFDYICPPCLLGSDSD